MKSILKYSFKFLYVSFVALLPFYLLVSLYNVSINIGSWDDNSRYLFCSFGVAIEIFICIYFCTDIVTKIES
jgi:hypothetical protein